MGLVEKWADDKGNLYDNCGGRTCIYEYVDAFPMIQTSVFFNGSRICG